MEIRAPTFPESIEDGTLAAWHRQPGEAVRRDEMLAEIETDKVVIEIVAPRDGALTEIVKAEGETVESDEVIARFEPGAVADTPPAGSTGEPVGEPTSASAAVEVGISPAARKLAEEEGIDIATLNGSGRGGRITKADVSRAASMSAAVAPAPAPAAPVREIAPAPESPADISPLSDRVERRVPMTRLRASIAQRLLEAQHNAAMLTTFNEVNMEPVMTLRARHRDAFERAHNGTRLGFMGFFVRVSAEALKRFPLVNACIDGDEIVYHGFYDIGVAVSTVRGLVVPVLRDADALSIAQIEEQIAGFGARGRDNKLTIEEMTGGTFTISNGGVFGSLLSTPILNPPQTAILGMHKIEQRPVVEEGEIVARPMMYLALTYDHRLIDGQEAVRFLVTIKELLEDPARILLEI
ncbi:MAG: 2-oxoglutarate dehydrogenase complex dihydrolipoyllysine-residue succinyltransferase [Gammaproteobacteria bacterium]|nr:2-oxoglutarate dehydrogenase complex dihydrolipoyllysine-residue succinyltransferase [Gammaproteobacteria bacterium]